MLPYIEMIPSSSTQARNVIEKDSTATGFVLYIDR